MSKFLVIASLVISNNFDDQECIFSLTHNENMMVLELIFWNNIANALGFI